MPTDRMPSHFLGIDRVDVIGSPCTATRDVVVPKLLMRSNVERWYVAREVLYFDGVQIASTGELFDSEERHLLSTRFDDFWPEVIAFDDGLST